MQLADGSDLSYVEDGTACGPNMLCLDHRCLPASAFNFSTCPGSGDRRICSHHGVGAWERPRRVRERLPGGDSSSQPSRPCATSRSAATRENASVSPTGRAKTAAFTTPCPLPLPLGRRSGTRVRLALARVGCLPPALCPSLPAEPCLPRPRRSQRHQHHHRLHRRGCPGCSHCPGWHGLGI